MRQEPLYVNTDFVVNRVINNYKTSSDLCFFNHPKITIDNTGKIESGVTINSDNVIIVQKNISNIFLNLEIIDNNSIEDNSSTLNYKLLKRVKNNSIFSSSPIYDVKGLNNDNFTDSGLTINLDTNKLQLDSEFIIKLSHNYKNCNYGLNLLNEVYSTPTNDGVLFNEYNSDNDYYFIAIYQPEKPKLVVDVSQELAPGSLFSESVVISENQQTIEIAENYSGAPIIVLNGLVLTENEDYSINNNIVYFNDLLVNGDLINAIYTFSSNGGGITNETFLIDKIVSGSTNNEGVNTYFYNETTDKYELFVKHEIDNFSGVIITLNGIVLANGIDYYQSTTNKKRIILNGIIFSNDIINVFYTSINKFSGNITSSSLNLIWELDNPITNESGEFLILVSEDESFTNIYYSDTVQYSNFESLYNKELNFTGEYGKFYYIKVVNSKEYTTILNEKLYLNNQSDVLKLVINTNSFNSY